MSKIEGFKDRYDSIQDVVDDTYSGGYYTKEDIDKYGCCLTLTKVRNNKLVYSNDWK